MARSLKVECDICGDELDVVDQAKMTAFNIIYREMGKTVKPGEPEKEFISKDAPYQIEICKKHSFNFMKDFQTLLNKYKESK